MPCAVQLRRPRPPDLEHVPVEVGAGRRRSAQSTSVGQAIAPARRAVGLVVPRGRCRAPRGSPRTSRAPSRDRGWPGGESSQLAPRPSARAGRRTRRRDRRRSRAPAEACRSGRGRTSGSCRWAISALLRAWRNTESVGTMSITHSRVTAIGVVEREPGGRPARPGRAPPPRTARGRARTSRRGCLAPVARFE